ncbi:MAG: AAA family ATPase, partial [Nocardiopsaceae bacterium]|nr:AAA family ATPase [Nocardiopsaceae bacterium]
MIGSQTDLAGDVRGFPPPLTSFVGRGDELDRLIRLLATHRLVTVVGPGGVGKTRLAAEVTRRVRDRFDNRIWLVELAAISAPRQVPSVIGGRLGVQQQSGRSTVQAVADVLAGAPTLLVLDNCEHLVEAVAAFCSELLARCDDVVILTTSREQLGVTGESRLRLRPLTTKTSERTGAGPAAGVALFVDRVRLADPSFELTAESAALAPQIVTRLDGLPLAIELAAARVEFFGMSELHTRLATPLRVLTQGSRAAPLRQRSLRATADWSYQLLSDPLRRVFRRLAVLPGPFTLQAAEAV